MRRVTRQMPHLLRQRTTLHALQRTARGQHPFGTASSASLPLHLVHATRVLQRANFPTNIAMRRAQRRVFGHTSAQRRAAEQRFLSQAQQELAIPLPQPQLPAWLPERLSRWLSENAPKGFGHFYPRGGAGARSGARGAAKEGEGAAAQGERAAAESQAGKAEEKAAGSGAGRSSNSGGGGKKGKGKGKGGERAGDGKDSGNWTEGMKRAAASGGAGGQKPSQEQQQTARLVAMMLLASALHFFSQDNRGQEISWQEFKTFLLEAGEVDRVLVVNKQFAKVLTRTPQQLQGGRGGAQQGGTFGALREKFGGSRGQQQSTQPDWQQQGAETWASDGGDFQDQSMQQGMQQPGMQEQPQQGRSRPYPRVGGAGPSASEFYFTIGSVEQFERQLETAQRELGIQPRDFIPVQYVSETNWGIELLKLAPTLLVLGVIVMMMRGSMGGMGGGGPGGMNNIFKIGKSNAQKVGKEDVNVTFKDVAGVDEAKREIMEFVQFLKKPKRFTDLGAKIPKGAVLVGPPGTGKTLLAKATAGEASVPFYSISGSDFIEMFVGVGPSRVRDLFKEARANAPCIVFIDEIDAVARQRGKGGFSGGNDERENTLNQLLVEMDGFKTSAGIVVLAGTNRIDILDQAILRPGRFDRQITVDLPDISGRKDILMVHLDGLTLDGDKEEVASKVAALTPGFSGADLANIANEAAIVAARREAKAIELVDFEQATDRVIGGLETGKMISDEEKRTVAYHEAGHAITGWNLEHADPLLKVTIVPRGKGSLGFAQYLPKEIALHSKEQLTDTICMALGGRAAEEINFGRITTGAGDDLRRVTQMAYQMISVYGMNDRIGQLSFPKEENAFGGADRAYSEATAQAIDEEAKKMVDELYARTKELLVSKQEQVTALAEELLIKETINHDDIVRIIGKRPYEGAANYQEFVAAAWDRVKEATADSKDADAEAGGAAEDDIEDAGGATPVVACRSG